MKSDMVVFTRSQKLLYFIAKLAGLAPFTLKDNKLHPVTFLSKAYNIILISCIVSREIVLLFQKFSTDSQITPAYYFMFSIAAILHPASSVFGLLLLSFKSEVVIEIMKRMDAIEDQLRRLKTTNKKDEKIFKICIGKIVALNVVSSALRILIDLLVNMKDYLVGFTELHTFVSLMVHFQRFNTILIFVHIVDCINKGFGYLNSELKNLVQSDCETFTCYESNDISAASRVGNSRFVAVQAPRRETIRYLVERVIKIRLLHKELCELLEHTTKFFTIPLLWIVGYQFLRLLLIPFTLYRYVTLSSDVVIISATSDSTVLRLIAQIIALVLEIYLVTKVGTVTYKVGNTTKVILHQVWSRCQLIELRDEFRMFSLQLLRTQVVVSILGILHLDYTYLYQISCATLTYFIIIIQLKNF